MDPKEIALIIDAQIEKRLDRLYSKQYQRGIISTVSGHYADVKIEGNTTAYPNMLCLWSYTPVVNDRVLILSIGKSGANYVVLGKLGV